MKLDRAIINSTLNILEFKDYLIKINSFII